MHGLTTGAQLDRPSGRFYRLVVENCKDLVCLVDLEGQIVFASPSYTTLLGIAPEEMTGNSALDFVHPDDRRSVELGLAAVVRDGFVAWTQAKLVAADGTAVPVEGSATVVPDDAGEPQLILMTSRDITERLRAERLAERLHQAQKLESVGKLAGGVAHDFNNLLTAINGYSDLALASMGEGADRLRASVREIRRAGERAAELTQQLLAFSRQQVLQPELIDLNRTVAEFGPMLARLIGEDVLLALRLGNDVSAIRADRGQIGQVVLNLAVNARDAMPDGGTLTISTQTVEASETTPPGLAPGWYSVLSVTDAGVGIPPELIDDVFEPFFTTKGIGQGTGLGLSTVHGIVEQSGGCVSVESEPGLGTTFRVYLPAVDEAVPEPKELPVESPTGNERVLLVEDNDAVRGLVREMLEDRGYEVVAAAGPREALQAAAELESIDLLVTDVVMPELNGRQLAERLVADRPGLRVLFISGYTDDAMIARGVLESDVLFLQKPFSVEELAVKVRQALAVALAA
jgi:two-component system cell cycle sensor histidine kinase/response regulator CckA